MLVEFAVCVVVACRLLVRHGYRSEQAVAVVYLPRKAGFGVEEVESLVNLQLLQRACGIVPLVVAAVYLVSYMTVLHVGIEIQAIGNTPVSLQVYIAIVLGSVVAVVFVSGLQVADMFLYPQDLSEVSSEVTVVSAS